MKYYCGGYGGIHVIPRNTGRHWFACNKCRWNPNYRDTDAIKAAVLASMAGKK